MATCVRDATVRQHRAEEAGSSIAGAAVRTVLVCLTISPCPSAQATKPALPKDLYGDPLPPGAVARLGTMRLRHADAVDLTYSKDGKRLVSFSEWDSSVRVWDAAAEFDRRPCNFLKVSVFRSIPYDSQRTATSREANHGIYYTFISNQL